MDSEDGFTLFCGNISPSINEEILYELFMQAGPIKTLRMPKRDNAHRGFAFVTFTYECALQYAVDLFEGTELAGRSIIIQNKSRREYRSPDIYDVLGSALEVPFGPLKNHMDAPMLSLPHQSQHNNPTSYSNHFPHHGQPPQYSSHSNHFSHHGQSPQYSSHEQHASHNNFQGKPYQRYHSTDRNRSDRTNADRNRGYEPDRSRHSDRRHSDNHSDRHRHSNRPSHARFD